MSCISIVLGSEASFQNVLGLIVMQKSFDCSLPRPCNETFLHKECYSGLLSLVHFAVYFIASDSVFGCLGLVVDVDICGTVICQAEIFTGGKKLCTVLSFLLDIRLCLLVT